MIIMIAGLRLEGYWRVRRQAIIYIKMVDSDIEDYISVIKNWKTKEQTAVINDILIRCQKVPSRLEESEVTKLADALNSFHKQINKASAVEESWFKEVIGAKKHLRKILDQKKKEEALLKQPKLIKSTSEIAFPEHLEEKDCLREKEYVKVLYKNFLLHLEEDIQKRSGEIVNFLTQVVQQISKDVGYDLQATGYQEEKSKKMIEQTKRVGDELARQNSCSAKLEMLEGKKSAAGVARLEEQAYVGEQLRQLRNKKLEAIALENQTGYYDQMKKNINKDAKEECRFCRKLAAYCEDMKQIRSADEPMTRFMLCNSCGKRWRQE